MNSCFKFYQRKKLPSHLMETDLNNTDNTANISQKPLQKLSFQSASQEDKSGCGKAKWNEIMEEISRITSPNSKEERCKDFINSELSRKLDSVRKSTRNDDCVDLTQESLAELCDWLITGYQQIAGEDDLCKSQKKDVLLTEIQKNLKQLMVLRRCFDERKNCRSFSARKPQRADGLPECPTTDQKILRACGSCKNFNKPRKTKQPGKCPDAAELLKNYNQAMKGVCNQTSEGNTSKCSSFGRFKDRNRDSKELKNPRNCDSNFKNSLPKRKPPKRIQSDLEYSSGAESYLPCFQSFKNQKSQSKRGSGSSAKRTSKGSKSICGESFKLNRPPKNSSRKACFSESSETCDIIKDCKEILKMPSQLKVYGLSESPMVVNVRDGKRCQNSGFKSDFDCRQQGLQFDECETAWKQVKRGLKNRDNFCDCLQKTFENREPKNPAKRKDTIESLCSVINMNSNSSVRNFIVNNNSSEHNNSRVSDNTFNSLGMKLYSAIKDKFNQSFNILAPFANSLRRESEQQNCTLKTQLQTCYNDIDNAEQPVPANFSYQQLNNSSNNHKGSQPIRSIVSKQRISEPQNQMLDTTIKADWRSKIEYWDITIADVKECSASSSAEDAASRETESSTNKHHSEFDKNYEKKRVVNSHSVTERVRGFFMGEVPLLMADVNRSDIRRAADMDSVKIIVNSNVNAGQRDTFNLMDLCKIKRPKSKSQPYRQPNKKTNNSNSIKNRPPWKPINTSQPPKKRKPRVPPPPQTCLVIPNTFLPIRNNSDIVEYPNYVRENDKSNNNCCYCCQQDCCCQQLALQMQLQQHCRYLEDMLERKQEELKAEMRQLHESSSSKRVDDPCANICSNKEPTMDNDDIIRNCLNQLKKNSMCRDSNQSKARNSAFHAPPCGNNGRTSRAKNESWWVDVEKKQNALCQSSSSSQGNQELEDFKNELRSQSRHRSSKMCDDNQRKEPINSKYKELFRKISSTSSCDRICDEKGANKADKMKKAETVEKVDGGTNPKPKDKCCQTAAESGKQYSNNECQTNSKFKNKPSDENAVNDLDALKNSKDASIQCENNGNELDKIKLDSESCEMAFRKCMKQAKEALAEQGPNIDSVERLNRSISIVPSKQIPDKIIREDMPAAKNCQDQPSAPPNLASDAQRHMMKVMNLNAEDLASKLRDVQTIINAFREKCDKSKKGFKDLKTICKQWQDSTSLPKEDNSLDCDFLINSQANEKLRTKQSKFNECTVSNSMKDRDCLIPKTKNKTSKTDSCLVERSQKVSKEKKRPSWRKDNSASTKSDELVHRWIERCLKQKMSKSEKLFDNLKSSCEVDERQSKAVDKRSSTRDDQTASCDDATWECQLMMDKSPESNALLSPTSRKEQLRNQIMDAIECYCREYGSTVQGRDGCGSSGSKKRELFKELKKTCKSRDRKSNLKDKSPKGQDRRKKVKLSFEDIVQAKCKSKPSRQKQNLRDAPSEQKSSFSSNICDQTPSSSFSGPSKSHSQLSCQQNRKQKKVRDLSATCNFSNKNRKKCKFCDSSSEETDRGGGSMSSSEIQKKLSNICRFSRKNINRSHSNRSCSARFSGVSAGDLTKSPSRSRKSSSRQSCLTSSPRSSCRPSFCSASLKGNSFASPRRNAFLDKSSTSRESLLSCLQAVLTKRRLERAIKEECLKWDVRRSCQLEKIEKCL